MGNIKYKQISPLHLFIIQWFIAIGCIFSIWLVIISAYFMGLHFSIFAALFYAFSVFNLIIVHWILFNSKRYPFIIKKLSDNFYSNKIKNHTSWFCGRDKVNSFVDYKFCIDKCPYKEHEVFECSELPDI